MLFVQYIILEYFHFYVLNLISELNKGRLTGIFRQQHQNICVIQAKCG